MTTKNRPANVITLKKALEAAEKGGFAIGSFSPRYTAMITPVLKAAQKMNSPAIVQISSRELDRYGITAKQFAD
ncbi:MAG TPA: class II fructose-bisphosphate aldolase, partial [Paenibacillus sp.]|nr:class II fructose-bisphosphate aldolase [Paenibacillus sp.]